MLKLSSWASPVLLLRAHLLRPSRIYCFSICPWNRHGKYSFDKNSNFLFSVCSRNRHANPTCGSQRIKFSFCPTCYDSGCTTYRYAMFLARQYVWSEFVSISLFFYGSRKMVRKEKVALEACLLRCSWLLKDLFEKC